MDDVDGAWCWLEGTAPSGFEATAREEVQERWPDCATELRQGGVFFRVPVADVRSALTLRSFDKVSVVVYRNESFDFARTADACAAQVVDILDACDWETPLQCWRAAAVQRTPPPADTPADAESRDTATKLAQAAANFDCYRAARREGRATKTLFGKGDRRSALAFRATCYRSGSGHPFTSQELQYAFGMALQDAFGFVVDLEGFDIEVILAVWFTRVCIAIPLNYESLHRRNVVDFGYTTLRATICHGLLRAARVRPGDVVCDPMCGSGAIIAEAFGTYGMDAGLRQGYLAGDCYRAAVEKCVTNCEAVRRGACSAACVWDASQLPLREGSVDVFVTDLPFGRRMGIETDNRKLYADVLRDLARAARLHSGRAVLLSADTRSLRKAAATHAALWKQTRVLNANVGGLRVIVVCLQRTDAPVERLPVAAPRKHRSGPHKAT